MVPPWISGSASAGAVSVMPALDRQALPLSMLLSRAPARYEAGARGETSMDRLILLRHAKAENDAPSGDDFDRPLAPRGRREAAAMAGQLAALGIRPDLALVSPSLRTRETWEAV